MAIAMGDTSTISHLTDPSFSEHVQNGTIGIRNGSSDLDSMASTEATKDDMYAPREYAVIIACLMRIITAILGTFGNIAVFTVVYRSKYLHTWENGFHVNLAAMDLIVSVVLCPLSITYDIYQWEISLFLMCNLYMFPFMGNLLSLAAIAILRYKKFSKPAWTVRSYHVVAAVTVTWIWCTVVTLLHTFKDNDVQQLVCPNSLQFVPNHLQISGIISEVLKQVTVFSCLITFMYCYNRLFLKVHKDKKQLEERKKSPKAQGSSSRVRALFSKRTAAADPCEVTLEFDESSSQSLERAAWSGYEHLIAQDKRIAMSSLIVVLVFFLCHIPFFVILLVDFVIPPSQIVADMAYIASAVSGWQSFLNPYVYTLRSQHFRKGVEKHIPCLASTRVGVMLQ